MVEVIAVEKISSGSEQDVETSGILTNKEGEGSRGLTKEDIVECVTTMRWSGKKL